MAVTIDARKLQSPFKFTLTTLGKPKGETFTIPPLDSDAFMRISMAAQDINQQNPNDAKNIVAADHIAEIFTQHVTPKSDFQAMLSELKHSAGTGKQSFAYVYTLLEIADSIAKAIS